jgi:hypothetical protein
VVHAVVDCDDRRRGHWRMGNHKHRSGEARQTTRIVIAFAGGHSHTRDRWRDRRPVGRLLVLFQLFLKRRRLALASCHGTSAIHARTAACAARVAAGAAAVSANYIAAGSIYFCLRYPCAAYDTVGIPVEFFYIPSGLQVVSEAKTPTTKARFISMGILSGVTKLTIEMRRNGDKLLVAAYGDVPKNTAFILGLAPDREAPLIISGQKLIAQFLEGPEDACYLL